MNVITPLAPSSEEGAVLSKAAFRAAQALGLSQKELAGVIGVSAASVNRMQDGRFRLTGKPLELAACLIRVFRSLDAIVGGDRAALKSWMEACNNDLSGVPKQLVQTAPGLIGVVNYLDASRAPI